jgi:hypothetical protein
MNPRYETTDEFARETRNPDSHAVKMPTGDRADKHAKTAEPHQTPVTGDEATHSAEQALDGTDLTHRDVLDQAAYRGNEADVGQQAATSKKSRESGEQVLHEDRG